MGQEEKVKKEKHFFTLHSKKTTNSFIFWENLRRANLLMVPSRAVGFIWPLVAKAFTYCPNIYTVADTWDRPTLYSTFSSVLETKYCLYPSLNTQSWLRDSWCLWFCFLACFVSQTSTQRCVLPIFSPMDLLLLWSWYDIVSFGNKKYTRKVRLL